MLRVHKWSTGFSSGAYDGHTAYTAPTYSTRPMGGGAHAARGHTSDQRLTGAGPCRSTHRNQGNVRRAHAAAFEGTLAALASLPSRAGGAVVRRRAYSTRLNARCWVISKSPARVSVHSTGLTRATTALVCTDHAVLRCRQLVYIIYIQYTTFVIQYSTRCGPPTAAMPRRWRCS